MLRNTHMHAHWDVVQDAHLLFRYKLSLCHIWFHLVSIHQCVFFSRFMPFYPILFLFTDYLFFLTFHFICLSNSALCHMFYCQIENAAARKKNIHRAERECSDQFVFREKCVRVTLMLAIQWNLSINQLSVGKKSENVCAHFWKYLQTSYELALPFFFVIYIHNWFGDVLFLAIIFLILMN